MAYSTSNPPSLISQRVAGGPALWFYSSADAEATFDDSGYITNADDIGMQTNDVVLIVDTTNNLVTIGKAAVSAGAATLSALTAFV